MQNIPILTDIGYENHQFQYQFLLGYDATISTPWDCRQIKMEVY